ncbi:MAG: hypothetical protein DBY36_05135 [Clostridiales bacterium]|nr:MAG: hypothetical protein DBY36_05135 [Clostridiales bacterium]
MEEFYSRTALLFGADGVRRLKSARVAVIGLGGVGSAAAESLARTGVGQLVLADGDRIAESNLNRQLFALRSTLGQLKTDAAAARIADINPDCRVEKVSEFLGADSDFSFLHGCVYCLDAIDDVRAKLLLYQNCRALGIPVIAAMGCGNRLDPAALAVTDVFSVTGCPLCRKIRHELRKLGIDSLPVVASAEPPRRSACSSGGSGQRVIASAAFVPNAAGLIMASAAVEKLCGEMFTNSP